MPQFAFVWTLSALAQTLTGRVVGDYDAAEGRVAADRVGLWQDANPTAPWGMAEGSATLEVAQQSAW